MYMGCKLHPTSLIVAQPIYLSTGVVFALYSIRGYRISVGLFLGGFLAYYFSPELTGLVPITAKILTSIMSILQILFCAYFIRLILDKLHMTLVSMRNIKEIVTFIFLALITPQLIFNLLITPSLELMVTGLGHTLGLLTITSIFLVWDAYVPKISPAPLSKKIFILTNLIWLIIACVTYLFCHIIYNLNQALFYPKIVIILCAYIFSLILLIGFSAKISNRFLCVVSLGFMGLSVFAYAIIHPEIVSSRILHTAYIQIGVVLICSCWLMLLPKLK